MHFIDHPDERAVESLVALALDPQRYEDEQYYAAEAVLRTLDEEAYVERFARAFREFDGRPRYLALSALAEWAKEASREILLEALEDDAPRVVSLAVGALGRTDDLSLADTLRPFAEHEHADIRRSALQAMSRLDSEFATKRAIADLESGDFRQRFNAAMQLGEKPSKLAVGALIARLRDPDESPKVRFKAIEALGAIRDQRAFEPILEALDDASEDVRSTAARILGNFADPRAIEPLSSYLHARHDGPYAHSEAAMALGNIGHPDAIPPLLDALADDREPVRQWACDALRKIEPPRDMRSQVIDRLVERLDDDSSTVRQYALWALGELGAEQAADEIARFLEADNDDERWRAVGALGDLRAVKYADAIAARRDDTGFVQPEVATALGKIGRAEDLPLLIEMLDVAPKEASQALAQMGDAAAIDELTSRAEALTDPDDAYTRVEFLGAAARLGHQPSADALADMLEPNTEQTKYAAIALVRAGDERGVDECCRQVQSDYWNVKLLAVAALGEYGEEAVRPVLEIALEDRSMDVHAEAKAALEKLG